jgi:hypothetical protein
MAFRFIEFDNPVYSDSELTTEITYTGDDGLLVNNTTQLPVLEVVNGTIQPVTVYYSEITYRATGYGRNRDTGKKGNKLYTVDFTYPADVTNNMITNGVYDAP